MGEDEIPNFKNGKIRKYVSLTKYVIHLLSR